MKILRGEEIICIWNCRFFTIRSFNPKTFLKVFDQFDELETFKRFALRQNLENHRLIHSNSVTNQNRTGDGIRSPAAEISTLNR